MDNQAKYQQFQPNERIAIAMVRQLEDVRDFDALVRAANGSPNLSLPPAMGRAETVAR
jgi:hypothetical protein